MSSYYALDILEEFAREVIQQQNYRSKLLLLSESEIHTSTTFEAKLHRKISQQRQERSPPAEGGLPWTKVLLYAIPVPLLRCP